MSTTKKSFLVPRYDPSLPHISEIMNKKLKKRTRSEVRKIKISRALFGVSDRKSPELTPKILGKRRRNRVKKLRRNGISTNISVLNSQQSDEALVTEPGPSSSVQDVQDVFNFPSESGRKEHMDSQVKRSVLKMISRMLEENRAIRQRLLTMTQKP